MARNKSFVIVWTGGAAGLGPMQYESKEAAIEALEKNGAENAGCVVKGTLVQFGQRVNIDDAAPRKKKEGGAKRGRKPKNPEAGNGEGTKVGEDFFAKPGTDGATKTTEA